MIRAVVYGGLSKAAARKYNTTAKTVGKWVKRSRTEGVDGLRDRSSSHSVPIAASMLQGNNAEWSRFA